MDVENIYKPQENTSSLGDFPENGGNLVNCSSVFRVTAGEAEQQHCSRLVHSHPTSAVTYQADNCCLREEDSVSGQSLADVQVCENTSLSRPLTTDNLLSEQPDAPPANQDVFVKGDSGNSATTPEIYAEKIPAVSEDFSDDDLEYFECSDVLTVDENAIWKKKLQFLLESDDEDDLKLSKDCDGCAYFLPEMPCLFPVSDNTTPMDTTIGFCGHHSTFKDVRRDPSMYSQSALQTDMTLTVGHHRDRSSSWKDKEKYPVPVAPAAAESDHPSTGEGKDGSGHSAAGFCTDKSRKQENTRAKEDSPASGIGAALAEQAAETMTETRTDKDLQDESSLLLEEGGRNLPEESGRHAVCTLTESLRRNLFKLLNPKELCRYVSNIGQSLQAAAELREPTAQSPRQDRVPSTGIPKEMESLQMQPGLCQAEELDKDCHWEGKRTWGLSEQNQMTNENISPGNRGADLEIFSQNCERLFTEPRKEREDNFVTCENVGTIPPAPEMLCTEKPLQAEAETLQTCCQHHAACDEGGSCHQQAFGKQGMPLISSGTKAKSASPSALQGAKAVCAALLGKLFAEPGHGGQGSDWHDGLSWGQPPFETCPRSALESGDADISAVHDKLQKLLPEDHSDCQIPSETRGITSLEVRPADTVTELNFVQPAPTTVQEEQEPTAQSGSGQGTNAGGCSVSNPLLKSDEASNSASIRNICLAQVVETDCVCLESCTGNRVETPSSCVSANSINWNTGECLEQKPDPTLAASKGSVQWSLAISNSSQPCEERKNAQSGNLVWDTETPPYTSDMFQGTLGQLLHTEHDIPSVIDSATAKGCHLRDYYPAGKELAYVPEEKGIFPSENTSQFKQEEHSLVNTIHESYEENSQEKGNHSDLNAQNVTNSDSHHLSNNNTCQDFPVDSNAQKQGHVMQLPHLIKTPETTTCKNLPQNIVQLTDTENQEVAFPPSSGDPFVRDFDVEVSRCEPCKTGEQREMCTGDEQRAETSLDSGLSHVSESQTAVFPHHTSEQQEVFLDGTFKSDEELKMDSAKNHMYASTSVTPVSAVVPGRAQSTSHSVAGEDAGDHSAQVATQQLTVEETLPFLTPTSQAEGLLTSAAAAGCPGTGSQVRTESTQTGVEAGENWSSLEAVCRAEQEQIQGVPERNEEGAVLCESKEMTQRAVEHKPDELGTKPPLHALISTKAQFVSISTKQSCPDLISSSRLTEVDNSVKSPEYDRDEVMPSESGVSGVVNVVPVAAGNSQCCQEQPPRSRAQPLSLARATQEPFPINTERPESQEGSKSYQMSPAVAEPEPLTCKQGPAKGGHFSAGAKKKLPAAALWKKPRLEERGGVSKEPPCARNALRSEAGSAHKEDRKEQRKLSVKKDAKAPRLLKTIQAELFPDFSGNIKLCCQFGDIHSDSTVTWTRDSKLLARLQRSAQDDSPVSLAIAKASNKDQGMYYCCLSNTYGKVTAEFNLTSEVLEHLSSFQNHQGVEEIEFMQLLFREDFISDRYFGGELQGLLATEEVHFGEGMHRKAFRSRVLRGLVPLFSPGHPCVLKLHSAIIYGTRSNDDLVQKNYKLALQECYVQNTAREYAKIYAAEAEPLEGFGEVPEIIPIFLVHRPANNIPYATVEEELVGEFVKYSVRDGKEVNCLRRDSEAGQKCCTFQHWVYEKTGGNLLVTDLQGVGMKLTDVGIATVAKGYKGFKGNCSVSFIDQFRALHQCNKYCEMLGLKSLRSTHQKQRKAASMKSKNLPNSSAIKKPVPKKAREPRDFISSEH